MVFPDSVLQARRARVADNLTLNDAVLLVGAGAPVPLPEETDQTYPFRAHTDYFYLTGLECPLGVVGFDPRDGPAAGWRSFVPEVSLDERIWEGRSQPPGEPLDQLQAWLNTRGGRRVVNLGAPIPGIASDADRRSATREQFVHARRPKDSAEVDLLRRAAAATASGYAALEPWLRPGVSERTLQIELEAGFRRAGAPRPAYGTIVGAGDHAATLHFEPTDRVIKPGDFVLIDAGAEIDRYVCDVTRTYVAGRPSGFQRELYELVLSVEKRAIQGCRPGVEWKDLHLEAARGLTDGLIQLGILRGRVDTLIERDAHRLFFPHGLGHLVGLGVRDGSGLAPGRTKDLRPTFRHLRSDLPLQAGYVTTVEPGLYFIPALLQDPANRAKYADEVAWSRVDEYQHLGGVRIEDNVLVTDTEPEVLTAAIPKDLA